ncbi:MAG: hypothetical protein M0P12_04550 [Paludibacteraceae bacterium]|jgi:hypothetical protein|nr:hypothetical protein [Paludibacteraceae bacterium]MCK9615799.1 hypothetical protein [Candidatus Omnitrophota bacterium]
MAKKLSDKTYRNCLDEKGNCPYVVFNQWNVACCSIDNICQVEHYGCTPDKELAKKAKGE